MRAIYLANGADASSPAVGGGSAWGLHQTFRRMEIPATPIKLAPMRSKWARLALLAAQHRISPAERRRLFFLPAALELRWTTKLPAGAALIDLFQLSPPSHLADRDFSIFKYIDMTLKQLFEYDEFQMLSKREEIYDAERQSYMRAEHIYCFTEWARASVIEDYRIDRGKVSVLRPGANLPPDLEDAGTVPSPLAHRTLRLIFVGRDWRRKGLETLSNAAQLLKSQAIDVEISAVGPSPGEIAHLPCVRPLGYIDKVSEAKRLVDLVRSSHFGVLWSRAEGLPISLTECLSLGVPVLTSGIPPIKAGLSNAAALILEPDASAEEISSALRQVWSQPGRYERLKQQAVEEAGDFTWLPAARLLADAVDRLGRPGA